MNKHAPIVEHYPQTLEQPAEITVTCICGEWSYESQGSAGGSCDTNYGPDFEQHVADMEETE